MKEATLKKMQLEILFRNAIETKKAKYVGVAIRTKGMPKLEYIVNPIENAEKKLEYYQKAYDDDLKLKACQDIQITAIAQGTTMTDTVAWLNPSEAAMEG